MWLKAVASVSSSRIPAGWKRAWSSPFDRRAMVEANARTGRTTLLTIQHTESDLALVASRTFSFEVDEEGWTTESGTFVRTTGSGANGTNAHMSSSSDLDDQCDVARSPSFVLSDTSTLTLRLRYDIEPQSGNGGMSGVLTNATHRTQEVKA